MKAAKTKTAAMPRGHSGRSSVVGRVVAAAGLAAAVLGGGAAQGQEAAPYARAVKFDTERGLLRYYKMVEFKVAFDAATAKKLAEADQVQRELNVMQQNLVTNGLSLSDASSKALEREIVAKQAALRRLEDDANRELQSMRLQALAQAEDAMQRDAPVEAATRAADLIVLVDGRSSAIIPVGNVMPDITDAVAARMNAPCNADAACRAKHSGLPGIG